MLFKCPNCLMSSLEIGQAIDLPPDSRSDEITVQVIVCRQCGFLGAAVYEESRRGAPGTETMHHTGYRLKRRLWKSLQGTIKKCPTPRNVRALSWRAADGRWIGLDVEIEGTFPMELG